MTEAEKKRCEELAKAGEAHRFSSENQPPRESISEGMREYWQRRNLKNIIFDKFNKELKGTDITTWEAMIEYVKHSLLSPDSNINRTEKTKLILKLFDMIAPKEVDANVNITEVPKIVYEIIEVSAKNQDKENKDAENALPPPGEEKPE